MRNTKIILALTSVFVLLASCGPTKPWTKADKVLGMFYLAGHGADMATTETMLDDPDNYEMNPLLGRHPSDTEVLIWGAGTSITVLYIADRVPKLRKPLLFTLGVLGIGLAIRNSRL